MGTSVEYIGLTGDNAVDSLTTGYRWTFDGPPILNYSISGGFYGEIFLRPDEMLRHWGGVLQTFAQVANLQFVNLGEFDNPLTAAQNGSDINLSIDGNGLFFTSSNQWARGFFPAPQYVNWPYPGAAGDVFINLLSDANRLPSYEPGSQGWFLLLHELGHSLGLKHPHDDGGTGHPTFEELGIGRLDHDYVSVMSYNDDANWNVFEWDPATPMIFDVIGLQYLYGPNQTSNAGDTLYHIDRTELYQTLWDPSGEDTISLEGSGEGWYIELPNHTISSLINTRIGHVAPEQEVDLLFPHTLVWLTGEFENVIGSFFADKIVANDLANTVRPLGGNDWIDGGAGQDRVIYDERFGQSEIQASLDSQGRIFHTVVTSDGSDTLYNVEKLLFTDYWVSLFPQQTPAGQIYRLYQAAFERSPDLDGIGYWIYQSESGLDMVSVATAFAQSAEFGRIYGADPSPESIVYGLYRNALRREPDEQGFDYWVNQLRSNELDTAKVMLSISESTESQQLSADALAVGVVYAPWIV